MVPGTVFADRFVIGSVGSAGGMGTVYRARDRRGAGDVALKLLRLPGDDDQRRFEREGRILEQLDHPGVVRWIDHGSTPEHLTWLAMEWLDGVDLGRRLERGPLTVEETMALGLHAAQALAAAHALGVLHRDVKPTNLFLVGDRPERPKLIDFGIAFSAQEPRATASGVVMGTPAYMAPEQARGAGDVDLRADLFSLGCVLFECLAGRPPFEGAHALAVLAKILFEDAPALSALRPDVPVALEDLIARMLAKTPADRPASGGEVAASLAAMAATGLEPRVAKRSRGLTDREQRLVSVIVGGPQTSAEGDTISVAKSVENVVALRRAVAPFDARLELLPDGSVVAAIAGSGGATDQAARAARCALVMRDALPLGPIALATGLAILEAEVPLGEAIDRAVALLDTEATTAAGRPRSRVVLDEVTAGLLDARFEIAGSGARRELRGEVSEILDGSRRLLGQPTPFVGRDREIATLQGIFDACVTDSVACAALLTGPPGIGKSRVGHELLQRVRSGGKAAAIWIAHGDPMGAGSSWRLVAQMVARAVGLHPREALAVKQEKLRAHTARSLAGEDADRVAEFLGELVDAPFPDERSVQLRAARRDARLLGDQIRRALEDLLAAECARGPVLVIVEDLHWADAPSIAFLDAAPSQLADRPLMVLGLARSDVNHRFPRLWAARGRQEVRLGELSPKASERLARLALGDHAPRGAIERVVQRAAGNAFYLEELVRAVAEGNGDALPGTVLAMVQVRLESLSPGARRVLRFGSVFGESFWSGAVQALLGDAGAPADTEAPLAELREREILVRRRESRFPGEEEHAFRHAILRDTAYGMLTEDDRAKGHRLAGIWLEQAGEHDAMILAQHFDRGAERARSATWYARAAEQALEANDLEAVITRSRRAEEIGAVGEVLGEAQLFRGEAHLWRGELAAAGPCLDAAMRLLPPEGASWFRAAGGCGWAAGGTGQHGRLLAVAAELHASLGTALSGAALVAAAGVAAQLLLNGLRREADPFAKLVARVLEEPEADPILAAHAHEAAAMWALFDGDFVATSTGYAASAVRFDEAGDARQAARLRVNAGAAFVLLGLLDLAEIELRASIVVTERLAIAHATAAARHNLATALLHQGALADALALEDHAIAAFVEQGDRRFEGAARAYRAAILLEMGDRDGAEAEASRAVSTCASAPPMRCLALAILARVLLALDRPGDALRASQEAIESLHRLGTIEEGESLVRLAFAEALHATGDLDGAHQAIVSAREQLLARAGKITDLAWRHAFLTNIPENARTLALSESW